jgi:hypothetical protein
VSVDNLILTSVVGPVEAPKFQLRLHSTILYVNVRKVKKDTVTVDIIISFADKRKL